MTTFAIPIRTAEAVAAEINSITGVLAVSGWVAQRSYADWDHDFRDLNEIAVDVVYRTNHDKNDIELDDYYHLVYRHDIDIAIRKRFEPEDRDSDTQRLLNSSVDPLVTLLGQFHEHFVRLRNGLVLPSVPDTNWIESQVMSWVHQGKLRKGLFEGVVRLTFESRVEI